MELLADNLTAVESHLRALGWIEPAERLHSLTPAGAGNMNRTLRARLDSRSLILKQAVPFVARYPQIAAPVERLDVEACFYQAISGQPALRRHTPAVLGYDRGNRLLGLQDLGDRGDYTDLYSDRKAAVVANSIPIQDLAAWLAELHALPVDDALAQQFDNRSMRELNHAHIFDIPLRPDNGLDPLPGIEDLAASMCADKPLRSAAEQLGRIYLQTYENQQTTAQRAPALLHGDFYPGSWLRGAGADVQIIDTEFAFVGPREFDLGVWLAHLTFLGAGASTRDAALETYLGECPHTAAVDESLVRAFAGIEIIRRLLGVARLPLVVDAAQLRSWLTHAHSEVCQ